MLIVKPLVSSLRSVFIAALLLGAVAGAHAQVDDAEQQSVLAHLKQVRPDISYGGVEQSPIAGIYQVQIVGGPLLYVDKTGRFFIAGDLFEVVADGFVNRTEELREAELIAFNGERQALLASVKPEDMIIYAPEGETKATISVFTDVDCGYCRKLHREVPQLNRMGIAVQYLAFPRAGLGSNSYNKIASAWCADDPKAAMDTLKAGGSIDSNVCSNNPVAQQYELGHKVGVTGTPAIVLQDGSLVPGYMPAADLAARIGVK